MSAGVYPPGVAVERGAIIEGPYRYVLGRRWAPDGPVATFVMLNPSVADAQLDDPTIRRVVGFSRALECVAVHVLNLYAYRTPKPRELWRAKAAGEDIIGPRNADLLGRHVLEARIRRDPVVVAWGAGAEASRVAEFVDSLGVWADVLTALAVTRTGAPAHPLYLPAELRPQPWRPRA